MRNQLERAVERISNCALRDNIVNSINGVNQRLEKQINEKFKHFKDHLSSMDEQIQKDRVEANKTIQSVKKRTLGKITGKQIISKAMSLKHFSYSSNMNLYNKKTGSKEIY